MRIFVIGAGGAGSWLIPQLSLLKVGPITVVDKDKLEPSNMNRQLFNESDLGSYKAEAMKARWPGVSEVITEWYHSGLIQHESDDVIFGCVDNHTGRRSILSACDASRARAIIMGNGTTTADAYFYDPEWSGTRADPRVRYPELLSAHDGPLQAVGCTGPQVEDTTPQLVMANTSAVSLGLQLFWLWVIRSKDIQSLKPSMPVEYAINEFGLRQTKLKELLSTPQ